MSKRFVYVLKNSETPPRYYTGVTSDVAKRHADHNAGCSPHTAKYCPWSIDVVVEFADEGRALAFERGLDRRPPRAKGHGGLLAPRRQSAGVGLYNWLSPIRRSLRWFGLGVPADSPPLALRLRVSCDSLAFQIRINRAWQQGPAMLQALNILEGIDLKAMGYNSARYLHTLYQAMNLAFAPGPPVDCEKVHPKKHQHEQDHLQQPDHECHLRFSRQP